MLGLFLTPVNSLGVEGEGRTEGEANGSRIGSLAECCSHDIELVLARGIGS